MSAGGQVASARGASLVLLTLAFVAVSLAREYVGHLDDLETGRQLAAACWQKTHPGLTSGGVDGFTGSTMELASHGVDDFQESTLRCTGCPHRAPWNVAVTPDLAVLGATCDEDLRVLANRITGEKGEKRDTWVDSYRRVDDALFRKPVEVPVLGIKVTAFLAQLAVALLTLILLVEIRARVRAVIRAHDLGADEEWTAIDTEGRAETFVAVAWVGAVTVAPWLSVASLFTTVTGYLRATGSSTNLAIDALIVVGCVAYALAIARVSWSLLANLLVLRAKRREPPA